MAVVSLQTGVDVLSFILMSNHVHFVLSCSESDAKIFIDTFKRLYGIHFARKYKVRDYFRKVKVDIRDVTEGEESVEKTVAYVQMNPVAANICAAAAFYPWGTGSCFFNENPQAGHPVGTLSRRAQIKMLKSNIELPSYLRFCDSGYILPESYVKVKYVESLFRTPKRYNYHLAKSSKARKALEKEASPSFRDQSILASATDLCWSLFRVSGIMYLNLEQKAELLKQLHFRFRADINQLCRVVGLSYEEASEMLEL